MIYNIDVHKLTLGARYHYRIYSDMHGFSQRCGVAVLTLECG